MHGGSAPRRSPIAAILLSHVHPRHFADERHAAASAGTCDRPDVALKGPPSSTLNIALAKQAPILAGGQMHFLPAFDGEPLGGDPAKLVRLVRHGATTSSGTVVVTSVPASHTNGPGP